MKVSRHMKGKQVPLTLYMRPDKYWLLKSLSVQKGVSLQALLRQAIEELLEEASGGGRKPRRVVESPPRLPEAVAEGVTQSGAVPTASKLPRQRLLEHFATASRHVASGARVLAKQRTLIHRMRRDGHDISEAERLLCIFDDLHRHQVEDLEEARRLLGDAGPQLK